MDDGGQRLLDVIEDPQVLETFFRESFSSSTLDDSPRFDNVSSSTDSGLVSSGLDSLVFDGQLVDPLRGGPSHAPHHPHGVAPHVLQQVLQSPNLSAVSTLPSGASQLHHHQLHHQSQQIQPPSLLSQHHSQHQSSHPSLSILPGSLENECIGRSRDSCNARNDADHHTLQQLLASSPLNSSPQILQLHPSHQTPTSHHSHLQSQPSISQSQQHPHSLQLHGQPNNSSHLPPLTAPTTLSQHLQPTLQPTIPATISPTSQVSRSGLQQQQHHHHHHRQTNSHSQKAQHHVLQNPVQPPTTDIAGSLLPIGLSPSAVGASGTCSRLASLQSSPSQSSTHQIVTSAHELPIVSKPPTIVSVSTISKTLPNLTTVQSSIAQPGSQNVSSGRVQLLGGNNQVITSGGQILASGSQLLPGAQIVHQGGSTHVISGGSILSGSQVLPSPNVIPGSQVLSNVSNGQVFQSGQLIPSAQVLTNHLLSNSHVITSVGGLTAPATPLYVTPQMTPHIHAAVPLVSQSQVLPSLQTSTIASSLTSCTSASATVPQTAITNTSIPFTVPSKSPVSSLPRTSPVPYSATPSPHHATPSPSYSNRSAPSPHTLPNAMRSPAPPPPSPTVSSQQVTAVVSSPCPQGNNNFVSSVVGGMGMVQGLVSHLPIQPIGGTNGVVLTQGGNPMQVASGIKQVMPGSQLIQLVSSPPSSQPRQAVPHPIPKPIQPKQPQLLPKPSQGNVRQSTPPPPGKTLIGSRPNPPSNQQPIVLGTGQPQTVITGQQNLGSIVLNSSLLQAGLQQPILIPQPNGVQLLVRPAATPVSATQGQTLLVPVPGGQPQVVTSVGKAHQPQALVIPGSGQTPALMIPQGLASTLTAGGNLFGAAQGTRPPQPIIRLLAPQAPLQLQQINTPSGPTWVAVPVGQPALNIPGVFASSAVRALAPHVAPGTLQLAPSAVNMGSIQLPGGTIQVSSSQPLHLASPATLQHGIGATIAAGKAVVEENHSYSAANHHVSLPSSNQIHPAEKIPKKKSKKKKKERDSKEDKKGKGVSINLNELLKETGIVSEMIFDESEFGGLDIECNDGGLPAPSESVVSTIPTITNSLNNTSLAAVHSSLNPAINKVASSVAVIQDSTLNSTITAPSNSTILNLSSSLPTSMCLTLDGQGKIVLGPAPIGKSVIAPSQPGTHLQMMTKPPGPYIISNPESSTMTIQGPSAAGQLATLYSQNDSSSILKIDVSSPFASKTISPKANVINEMTKVAQNTQMIQTLQPDRAQFTNSSSMMSSLLNAPSISQPGGGHLNPVSLHLISNDKDTHLADDKVFGSSNNNNNNNTLELLASHSNQVPISNGSVIVTDNPNNSFLPAPVISSKNISLNYDGNSLSNLQYQASPISNITPNLHKRDILNNATVPISMHVIDSTLKNNSYQNQYLASVKNHTIVEACKAKKPSKKKKKDKDPIPSNHDHPLNDRGKSISLLSPPSSSVPVQLNTQVFLANGINSVLGSQPLVKSDVEMNKTESSILINSNQPASLSIGAHPIVNSSPNPGPITTFTSASTMTSISSFVPLSATPAGSSTGTTTTNKISSPNSHMCSPSGNVPGSFVFTGQQVLLQPGQQVKQLLITPQTQEALKRVHSQIQTLQNKKGPVTPQDKLLHQKLISEHKKIMATGKTVAVNTNPLGQVQPNTLTPQRSPVKYSHAVGHKKIFFSPPTSQKKGPLPPNSNKEPKHPLDHSKEPKMKNSDCGKTFDPPPVTTFEYASSQINPAITSFGAMTTTITTTSPVLSGSMPSPCVHSGSQQQVLLSPGRFAAESSKQETVRTDQACMSGSSIASAVNDGIQNAPRPFSVNTPNNLNISVPSGNFSPVSIIFSSTKSPTVTTVVSPAFSSPVSGSRLAVPHCSPVVAHPHVSPAAIPSSSLGHPQEGHKNAAAAVIISSRQQSPIQASSHATSQTVSRERPAPQHLSFSLPLTRDQLFEHQLKTDQNGALGPDYKTPFKNKIDACKRLIRYHVFNDCDPSPGELLESDNQFETQSESLLKKYNSMSYKYQSLLLKESTRRHPSADTVMLYRLFNQEEKGNFEREKNEVRTGKEFVYTKHPAEWVMKETAQTADAPYPWEENWSLEKSFVRNSEDFVLDEVGKERCEDAEKEDEVEVSSVSSDHLCDDKGVSEWEEEDEEELDEGQDEPRLQILVEDDLEPEEDSKYCSTDSHFSEDVPPSNERGNDTTSVNCSLSCDSDSVISFVQSPMNDYDDTLHEQTNRSSKHERTKPNSFYIKEMSENILNASRGGAKENGIDGHIRTNPLLLDSHESLMADPPTSKCDFYSEGYNNRNSYDEYHNSYRESDKSRRDKKYRNERDRRKHDKIKEKSRIRDRDASKSSNKLKIKLKHEDKALVPPLKIRTDERGSGGLKLTLKKQEGSGDYYRVNEELSKEKAKATPDNQNLQKVSVVLQNCLQTDWKCKRELEEDSKSLKRSKRAKSFAGQQEQQLSPYPLSHSVCDKYEFSPEKEMVPQPWSSHNERWRRQGAAATTTTTTTATSSLPANAFFYQSSPQLSGETPSSPTLSKERSSSSSSSSKSTQQSFLSYSHQTQSRKHTQLS